MPSTALIVPVPRVGPLISPWARRHDPTTAGGVPAHITVFFPFIAPDAITPADLSRLESVFATHPATEVELARVGMFEEGEVLHIRPEPDEPFRAMTESVHREWPALEPYGGRHEDPVPHVTVGFHIPRPSARHAARSLMLALPLRVPIDVVQLWVDGAKGWHHLATFPLSRVP